jgi:membrane-associated phospholipid phosphatase
MKGITLARFFMIVNITMLAACPRPAWPQEQQRANNNDTPAPTASDSPSFEAVKISRPQHENWFTTVRNDAFTTTAHVFADQKQIWTSPLGLRFPDVEWLLPLAGVTSGAILTDASFSRSLSNNPNQLKDFRDLRQVSLGALGAASAGMYLWSLHTRDPHQRETGLLAGEAMLDSLLVTGGLKYITARERPLVGNGDGKFFQGGNSFPSTHSAVAWAAAGIIAHEYHGTMTKLLAYGLASAVSVASVGSKEHFPSDVLIGSGLGFVISETVYRNRHNPELGGSSWAPLKSIISTDDSGPTRYPGSTYVPVDSWVYRAFDRLAALGYLSNAFQGTKPWSRERCAQLLIDVDEALAKSSQGDSETNAEMWGLLLALHHEFAREEKTVTGPNRSADIESLYSRTLIASGTVLTDGYHFGQTFAYDYGRPFREGTNLIEGASASATYGSLFFYVGAEFQHSPSAPALSPTVRAFIANRDEDSPPLAVPFAPINQFALLDAYAGINLHGWQITFGNQSLSWGPGVGGSLLLSNNAAPFPMLRIMPEKPMEIPGISRVLGPIVIDQFFGQLEGHFGPKQPWIYGQKISFKPVRSWEFAYSRTTLIGGNEFPLTSKQFFLSLFGRPDPAENSVPGDSRTAIDWTWRIPRIHDWVTFYGELEDDDDLIPFQNLSKSVVRPGLYFPRLPKLPKWDLHLEYTASTSPGRASFQSHGQLNYWNLEYPDGYTNNGGLLSNTVGREGVALQAWLRYWASPNRTLDLSWKQNVVLKDYVPGGGKWQDYQVSYSITKPSGVYWKAFLQFEHIFSYPLLFSGSKNNVTAAVEIGFLPPWGHAAGIPASSRSTPVSQSTGGPLP